MTEKKDLTPDDIVEEAANEAVLPSAPLEKAAAPEPVVSELGSKMAIMAVASALLMQGIDSTALSTALPTLARAFHADPIHLKLALTSYMLSLAVFVPASGWTADRFGARRVFIGSMVLFLIGSMLCGLSGTLETLVASRVVQGMGGAMMITVGRMIIVHSTPRDKLVHAMVWFGMPALIGPMIGPGMAGILLRFADWPWIFYVNVPVGILGIIAVLVYVKYKETLRRKRFDGTGFILVGVTIAAAMTVAETVGLDLISTTDQVIAGILSAICAGLYYFHSRRTEHPVLDLTLFRHRTFAASMLGGVLTRLTLGATPLMLPLLLQTGLGWTPFHAGMVSMATAFGSFCSRPFAPSLIQRIGFRTTMVTSAVLIAIFGSMPGWFRSDTPEFLMMFSLAMTGFGRATQFSTANTLAYAEIPEQGVSSASTILAVIQQVSLSMGVTLGALLLHIVDAQGANFAPTVFVIPFIIVGFMALIAIPVYLALPANAGADMTGRRRRH